MSTVTLRIISVLLGFVTLAGCSVLPDMSIQQNYILSVPDLRTKQPPLPLHLRVMSVDVAPGLDTSRIAFVDNDVQMNYMADSRWAQPLPEMIQSLWIQTLRQSGLTTSVGSDLDGEKADRIIHITASAFNAVHNHDGSISVHVHYQSTITAPVTHKVLSVEESSFEQPTMAHNTDDLISAFNKANAGAIGDLVGRMAIDLSNSPLHPLPGT